MVDISKCKGGRCPIKQACYRYTVEGGEWQAYMTQPPYDFVKGNCEYHMDNGLSKEQFEVNPEEIATMKRLIAESQEAYYSYGSGSPQHMEAHNKLVKWMQGNEQSAEAD